MKYSSNFKWKLKFLIIIFFGFSSANAQEPTKKEIDKVESLLDSAYQKTQTVDMKASSLFAKKALSISKQTGYTKGEAWSNFYIAQGLFELWAYKQSLHYLEKAEIINEKVKDKYLTFEIYRVRSRVFGSMELLDASVREQEKGLKIIPEIPRSQLDKDFLSSLAYENLAVTLSKMKKNELFFYYLSKNKQLLEKQNQEFVYPNLISLYAMLGAYYTDNQQYDKARFNFQQSKDIADKYKFPYISFTYRRWGDMHLAQKNPKAAIELYEKSLDILKKTNFKSEIPVVYHQLEQAYTLLGNAQQAKDFKLKALELQDQLKTEQLKTSSSAVEEILQNEKEEIKTQHSRYFIILIMLALVFLALIVMAIVKYYQIKKKKIILKSQEVLKNKEQEIKTLSEKVTASLEDLLNLAKENNPAFFTKFQDTYPQFSDNLLKINSSLTKTELVFCAYTYLGFNTKDIAEYTFKTPKSVENIRYYVRKKLRFSPDQDFTIRLREIVDQH